MVSTWAILISSVIFVLAILTFGLSVYLHFKKPQPKNSFRLYLIGIALIGIGSSVLMCNHIAIRNQIRNSRMHTIDLQQSNIDTQLKQTNNNQQIQKLLNQRQKLFNKSTDISNLL